MNQKCLSFSVEAESNSSIKSMNYISSDYLFIYIFFDSMLVTSTPYFPLLTSFQKANHRQKDSNSSIALHI